MAKLSNALKNKKHGYGLDYAIVFLTVLSLIFLMRFADAKLNEVTISNQEVLLVNHEEDNPIHQQLAEEIIKFRPEACKMIEVYSESYELMFSVQFKEDESNYYDTLLSDYPELISLFDSNFEGHTEIVIDDEVENIYFRWTLTTDGDKCLCIIYMSQPVVKDLWVFKGICIFIILLVILMLIRFAIHDHDQTLEMYQRRTIEVQDKIFLE